MMEVGVKGAECWTHMGKFGTNCCTNGDGALCGKISHCVFCLNANWQSTIENAPGCTHLLSGFSVEIHDRIRAGK